MFGKQRITRNRPQNDRPRYSRSNLQYYMSGKQSGRNQRAAADAPLVATKKRSTVEGRGIAARQHLARSAYYVSALIIAVSLIYCSIIGNNVALLAPASGGLYDTAYYQQRLSAVLNDSVWNHSKITFDPRGFKQKVLQSEPEIADVSVQLPFVGRRPVVGVAFRQPALVMQIKNRKYVVSKEGLVLAEAANVDPAKLEGLLQIAEDVPLQVSVGKPALTEENVQFITDIAGELTGAGLQIASMSLPLGASEVYVRLVGVGYTVKFASIGSGAKQQVGALLAVRNQLKDAPQPAEYIDVRLAERVFVK